jgi:hypothetical protein
MKSNLQWIPVGGLLGTIVASMYMVVQLDAQTPAKADFTKAAMVQVRDAQGQVVLQGQFAAPVEEDGGLERRATLSPTGDDADAAGEAEVEFDRTAPTKQEVEFSVKNLPAGASFTFVVDGADVATATTDRRGRAEVELKLEMPGRE